MSDKIRGALFNILGDIKGLTVLDAFAGSGALTFEAISRGAKEALAIESDRPAQETIEKNIRALGIEGRARLVKAPINSWLAQNPSVQFDLVLCDPPYDDLQPKTLQQLVAATRQDGIYVLSWPAGEPPLELQALKLVEHRSYGDAELLFYSR